VIETPSPCATRARYGLSDDAENGAHRHTGKVSAHRYHLHSWHCSLLGAFVALGTASSLREWSGKRHAGGPAPGHPRQPHGRTIWVAASPGNAPANLTVTEEAPDCHPSDHHSPQPLEWPVLGPHRLPF